MAIGKLVKPHGTRGEVAVYPLTENVERFVPGRRAYLCLNPQGEGDAAPVEIETSRVHQGRHLLKLDRIANRSVAEQHVGQYLVIPFAEAEAERAENEFFLHALVGYEVRTAEGQVLGRVVDVLEPGGAAALEIDVPTGGRRLLPFVREFVRDVGERTIVVEPPAGWEEL